MVGGLPALISSRVGLQASLDMANRRMPGRLEVAELQLGWCSPLRVSGVKVHDVSARGGGCLLEVPEVLSSEELWRLVVPGFGGGAVVVKGPVVDLGFDEGATALKLMQALGAAPLPPESPPPSSPSSSPAAAAAAQAKGQDLQQRKDAGGVGALQNIVTSLKAEQGKRVPSEGDLGAMLSKVDSSMGLQVDVRLPGLQVHVTEGELLVPQEIRDMIGPQVTASALLGSTQLAAWSRETGGDIAWTHQPCTNTLAHQPVTSPPPPGSEPALIKVHADHVDVEARAHIRGLSSAKLHTPATATFEFTPAVTKFGLAAANPLLRDVVNVRGGAPLSVSVAPEGLALFPPPASLDVRVEPLVMSLSSGSLVSQITKTLKLSGSGVGGGGMDVYTSRMDVHVDLPGPITTSRMDMMIGSASAVSKVAQGESAPHMHLVVWGSQNPQTKTLDMTVGVPASVLNQAGLRNLPEGYVLPLELRGSTAKPEFGFKATTAKLAELMLRQKTLELSARRQQHKETAAAAAAAGEAGEAGEQQQGGSLAQPAVQEAVLQGVKSEQRQGRFAGLLKSQLVGKVVDQVVDGALRLGSEDKVQRIEASMAEDMARVPPLAAPLPWSKPPPAAAAAGTPGAEGQGAAAAPEPAQGDAGGSGAAP